MEKLQLHLWYQNFIRSKTRSNYYKRWSDKFSQKQCQAWKRRMGHIRSRYRWKFLKLPINYSIVTNIDYEHLDYYKNYKNLEDSFVKFINKTPPTGKAIICIDNGNIKKF